VLAMIRRRLVVIIVTSVITLGAVATYTLLQTPVYEVETRMMVSSPRGGAGGLGMMGEMPSLLGISFGSSSTETQRLLLKSPKLLEKAAADEGLDWTLTELDSRVKSSVVENSDLLSVKVTHEDVDASVRLAERIAEIHIQESKSLAQQSTRDAADFIQKEMRRVEKDLLSSEEDVKDFKEDEDIIDLQVETESTFTALSNIISDAAAAHAAAAQSRQIADRFRRQLEEADETITASSTIARNPLVQQLEGELATLEVERAGLLVQFTPEHEQVQKLDEQIRETRDKHKDAVATAATVVESTVETSNPFYMELRIALVTAEAEAMAAEARESALRQIIDREEERLRSLPTLELKLGRLMRDTSIAGRIYAIWAEKYHEMKLNEAFTLSNIRITDHARRPEAPVKPRKLVNAVLGVVLATLLSIILAGIAEARDDSIRSEEEAEQDIGLPLLGTVAKIKRGTPLLDPDMAAPELLESFRNLRTNMISSQPEEKAQAILVTSPGAGDGKSTIAANLAILLAQNGLQTLIVDANLRRPNLHKALAAGGEPLNIDTGLSEALSDGLDALGAVQPTAYPNLSLLSAGGIPPNSTELLGSQEAKALLSTLREHFDAIVLDSPPCGALSDSLVLAPQCDRVLMVVAIGKTRRQATQKALKRLRSLEDVPLGLVVNHAKTPKGWYDY